MDRSYFVKKYSDSTKKFSETDIINMLKLLIESIFVIFVGRVFQQKFGISMCTKYAPLLADVFRYSYEVDFIQGLLNKDEKKLARSHFSRSVILTMMSFHLIILGLVNSLIASFPLSLK